jgi:hypothetical protein
MEGSPLQRSAGSTDMPPLCRGPRKTSPEVFSNRLLISTPMNQVVPNSGVMLAEDRAPSEVAISDEDREALKRAAEALEAPASPRDCPRLPAVPSNCSGRLSRGLFLSLPPAQHR